MRRFPISWSTTLSKLGFKRKRSQTKRHSLHSGRRRSSLEQLESRELLTGSPWQGFDRVLADFDGDGNQDRLSSVSASVVGGVETWTIDTKASAAAGSTESWRVTRSGSYAAAPGTLPADGQFLVGDFNGDKRDDILARGSMGSWYMIQSRASSEPTSYDGEFVVSTWGTLSQAGAWSLPIVGDFDGDGRDDLAAFDVSNPSNKQWQVVRSTGTSFEPLAVWAQTTVTPTLTLAVAGDFNGDGRDDLLFQKSGTSTWAIAISDGTRFNVLDPGTITTTWSTVRLGDFDGDGADELLGWNSGTSKWQTVTYNDHRGMTLAGDWGSDLGSIVSSQNVHIGDANRDRRDDLVVFDATPGVNKWKVALSQDMGAGVSLFVTHVVDADGTNDWNRWFGDWDWGPTATPYQFLNVDAPYQKFLDIFSDVYNTVELELYPGLMKGIEATAQTKAGNDWDQAALLVDRLEPDVPGQNEGQRSRLASGKVNVDPGAAKEWIGTSTNVAALNIIAQTLDTNAKVVNGKYQFTHAWVQALVPSTDGLKWIDVDPSWKFKDWQQGEIVNLTTVNTAYTPIGGRNLRGTFDEFGYLQYGQTNQLPVEWYEDQVMKYLVQSNKHKSLADVPYDGQIIHKQFVELPESWVSQLVVDAPQTVLTFANFAEIATSQSLSAQFTHRATVSIEKAGDIHLTHTLIVPKHSLDSINISYSQNPTTSSYAANLIVTPQSGGATTISATAGKTFAPGEQVTIKISHFGPTSLQQANPDTSTYYREPGQIHALGFDANQYSVQHIVDLQAKLNIAAADSGPWKDDIDELLSYTAAKYWYDLNRGNRTIDGLLHSIGGEQWVGSGMVTSDPYVLTEPIPGIQGPAPGGSGGLSIIHFPLYTAEDVAHLQFPILPYNMGIDLPNTNHISLDISTGAINDEAFQLGGYNGSALENAILEEVVNSESISTIRGLQRAMTSVNAPVTVYESVWDISANQRQIYLRGSITVWTSNTNYHPTGGSQQSSAQVVSTLTSESSAHSVDVADDVVAILENRDNLYGGADSQAPIRVLIPKSKSALGTWSGSVYLAQYDTPTGNAGAYIITPDGGTPSSGGISGNSRKGENKAIPPGKYINNTTAGDPVNVANGSMFREEVDFTFANPIVPLDFARHYDSQNKLDVGFGVGWVHSFTGFIYQEQDPANRGDVDYVWLRGSGERHTFEDLDFTLPNTLFGQIETTTISQDNKRLTAFQDRNGIQYIFEPLASPFFDPTTQKTIYGRLTDIKDVTNSQGVHITYEPGHTIRVAKVESISTPSRRLEFVYNSDNTTNVKRFDAQSNQPVSTWAYVLTTNAGYTGKRLTQVKHADPGTAFTNYTYFEDGQSSWKGLIQKITEPNGESHSYEYYANGRVFRVTDGNGNQQSFNYNLFRNLTEFNDENGNVETYIHQDNGLLVKQIHDDRSRLEFTWGPQSSGSTVQWEEYLMQTSTDEQGASETFWASPDLRASLNERIWG